MDSAYSPIGAIGMVLGLISPWYRLSELVSAPWFVIVLGIICLVQAGLYVRRVLQSRAAILSLEEELNERQRELAAAQAEHASASAENAVLNEFADQTHPAHAVEALLRRLIPHEQDGLAVVLRMDEPAPQVVRGRGLSSVSLQKIQEGAATWKDRWRSEEGWELEGAALSEDPLLANLTRGDRMKIRRLFGVPLRPHGGASGFLVTTSIAPAGVSEQRGAELVRCLLENALADLNRIEGLAAQSQRLETMRAMLELRSISDWKFESPLQMIEGFLLRLAELVEVDRAALFLSNRDVLAPSRALVRCGVRLQSGALKRWSDHEEKLARVSIEGDDPVALSANDLKGMSIDSLISSAVVVPLVQSGMRMGSLCLSRSGQMEFADADLTLLSWAGRYLAETILRVLNSAHIERQAKQDGLTELANRRTFDQRIEQELEMARKQKATCCLLLLDLDRFKSINDCYGHRTGDEVLKVAAKIVQTHVATNNPMGRNLVARYGGEELAVVLPGMEPENAERLAQAIRRAVASTPIRSATTELRVTVSGGLAAFPRQAETVEELIEAADSGLYHAKESGRNRICWAVREKDAAPARATF